MDILDEVKQDIRDEARYGIVMRYGKYILALSVFIVIFTAIYAWWANNTHKANEQNSLKLYSAIDMYKDAKYSEAMKLFQEIIDSNKNHKMSQLAQLWQSRMDQENINKYYEELSDSGVYKPVKDLAILLKSYNLLEQKQYDQVEKLVTELKKDDFIYKFQAAETIGVLGIYTNNQPYIAYAVEKFKDQPPDDVVNDQISVFVNNLIISKS